MRKKCVIKTFSKSAVDNFHVFLSYSITTCGIMCTRLKLKLFLHIANINTLRYKKKITIKVGNLKIIFKVRPQELSKKWHRMKNRFSKQECYRKIDKYISSFSHNPTQQETKPYPEQKL